jgi:hypothetical protein
MRRVSVFGRERDRNSGRGCAPKSVGVVSVAAKTLPIGNRAELGRWRGEVRKILAEVVS